jgi:hypothetical protein
MGFVARNNINSYTAKVAYMPRPDNKLIRQHQFRFSPSFVTDLNHQWESYDVSFTPINANFESGDSFSFSFSPTGEFLKDSFHIAEDVTIDPGPYHWARFDFEATTASKRAVNGIAAYRFGGFYGGNLDQIELGLNWRLMSFLILEFSYENNIARIPAGNFRKELLAVRTAFNINSNLNLSLFTQYDNESESIGSYSRLRWTFAPLGDLFVVYKHNIQPKITDRWQQDQNQIIVKLTYGLAL